jgi:hypothetical protein
VNFNPMNARQVKWCTFLDPRTKLLRIPLNLKEGTWQLQECLNQPLTTP